MPEYQEEEPPPITTKWYELKTKEFNPLHSEYLHQLKQQIRSEKEDKELKELQRLS